MTVTEEMETGVEASEPRDPQAAKRRMRLQPNIGSHPDLKEVEGQTASARTQRRQGARARGEDSYGNATFE